MLSFATIICDTISNYNRAIRGRSCVDNSIPV